MLHEESFEKMFAVFKKTIERFLKLTHAETKPDGTLTGISPVVIVELPSANLLEKIELDSIKDWNFVMA
ncbi:MAG: hypothetical protein ACOH2A_13085 [Sphingobacteriaceae bacterium]